jgi:hypothetical protein
MPQEFPLRRFGPPDLISYSFQDSSLAERLEAALAERGHQVRREDERSLVDQKLSEAIRKRIGEAEVLIQLLTPIALRSVWVERELAMANDLRNAGHAITVLPVLFEGARPSDAISDWWHLAVGSEGLSEAYIDQIHAYALRSIILLPFDADDPFRFAAAEASAMLDAVTTSRRRVLIDPGGQIQRWASDTLTFARSLDTPAREQFIAQETGYARAGGRDRVNPSTRDRHR